MVELKPPELERAVGLEVYKSKTPGIGGFLKKIPEDFVVLEVAEDGTLASATGDVSGDLTPGEFTHFTLVKKNWDTMRAVKEISRKVGVSQKRFSFAGTKDKYAISSQRISVRDIPIETLKKVSVKDLSLKDFSYADYPIELGGLLGNQFNVVIRDVSLYEKEIQKSISETFEGLSGGFPNFFGLQRFGIERPITHLVGKKLLLGDFEGAFSTYLAYDSEFEGDDARDARKSLKETGDFKEALRKFPKNLGYEHALLNHVVEHPGDFRGALKRLPKNLLQMFVHAFQSYVFNRTLSECIRKDFAVERLPLVGYETEVDDISEGILEGEGILKDDFRVSDFTEAGSKGSFRECFAPAFDFKILGVLEDELNQGKRKVTLSFKLFKGCYATVFLREFMKNKYW